MLCYTGHVRTDLGPIAAQIRMYEEGREDTIVGMKQLHAMAYEMRHEIEAGNLDRLGALLREAFESKKLMNPHISEGTTIDQLLAVARDAGAAGGKICGAGGGGYLLLACEPERQAAVREALEGVGGQFAAFAFRSHGVEARWGERVEAAVSRRFVLLDRDGTINEEVGYVLRPDELRLIPGAVDALRELQGLGLGLVVLTNQSPIGRDDHAGRARRDPRQAARPARGGRCQARPHRGLPPSARRGCACRKPGTLMVERAVAAIGFDPRES